MGWRVVWGCVPALSRTPGKGWPGSTQALDHEHFRKTLPTSCQFPFLTSREHLVFLDLHLAGWHQAMKCKKETRGVWVMILWL